MQLEWLFRWWNAIYSIPLAVVLVFLTVTSVVSLVGGAIESASHDQAGDVDVDADVDADVDVDVDADVDADVEGHPAHHGHGHHHGPGLGVAFLAFIGVGKAPFLLTFQILLLLWGLIGLGMHQALRAAGPFALAWSIPTTAVLSLVGTRVFTALFARAFRDFELEAVKRNDLVGRTGQVVYSVNDEEGTIHVRDREGGLQRVRARSSQGPFAPGTQVIVLGYDPERSVYEVDDSSGFVDR